jgi:hypothetical protein
MTLAPVSARTPMSPPLPRSDDVKVQSMQADDQQRVALH